MSVNNELARPATEEDFEAMCHQLYRSMWKDSGCMRVGRSGQTQFGVDVLGHDGQRVVGVQCKHYNSTPFTLKTVTDDVAAADNSGLKLGHLVFATTAPSKSSTVREVVELSESRRAAGLFTVSVDFWGDIAGHIRVHPEVGRAFIPNFPGGAIVTIEENTTAALVLIREGDTSRENFQATALDLLRDQHAAFVALSKQASSPDARGDEADPRVVTTLDFIRDRLREGKTTDAKELLASLGDPSLFRDQFSRFRWHTNKAAVDLQEGHIQDAAKGYLFAFDLAPDQEKALANKAHAFLLLGDANAALVACDEGLARFPESPYLWSLWLHAAHALNEPDPELGLPESLRDSADLLFSRARLLDKRGDFPGALDLLRQCMVADGGSFEAKRAYLADALSWASAEAVLPHFGQIPSTQRTALADAVTRLEPLEQTLTAMQSESASLELSNNCTIALVFLGQKERAHTLATLMLQRHPESEGLLRIRINQLGHDDQISTIRALTDSRLSTLPHSVLAILAEVSANRGDMSWHDAVRQAVDSAGIEPDKLRQIQVLRFHAQWVSGQRDEALAAAQAYAQEHPGHVLAQVMVAQLLLRLGQRDAAIAAAEDCQRLIDADSTTFDLIHVGDLLFSLGMFGEASSLFSRLVKSPGDDEFTWKLLVSLIESDQRWKAQSSLEQLAPPVRQLPQMRRIEANVARRMGDWARMRDILFAEMQNQPAAGDLAVGYVGALYRLGDSRTLTAFLDTDPRFKDSNLQIEFEFAKYQSNNGRADLAVSRLFRVYRAHPASAKAASHFLGQLLMAPQLELMSAPDIVGPGASVHFRSTTETWSIAVDSERALPTDSWPELVSPDSDVARQLHGLRVGDKATVRRGIGDQEVEIVGLRSLMAFAADKAHAQVSASAAPSGPLWSVRVIKEDGQLDIDVLLRSSKERRENVEGSFSMYRQHRFPLCTLAQMVGADPVTLLLDWHPSLGSMFVSLGTQEEREASSQLLRTGHRCSVLDLLTIAELVRHRAFDAVVRLLGKPLVPQTVREQLLVSLQFAAQPRASFKLAERDGRLQLTDVPPAYYKNREALLRSMLRCIDEDCEVVPTTGPEVVTAEHRSLALVLDPGTLDALYLCLERNAVLLSEDGALRLLAPEAGVGATTGIQPVLMEACARGIFDKEAYADAVANKLAAGHDFVSVRSEDLALLARRSPGRMSVPVRVALESFRKPTLDILSGVTVACTFLRDLANRLPPPTLAAYSRLTVSALEDGRSDLAPVIHRGLATILQSVLGRGGRRLRASDRKLFGRLLVRKSRLENLPHRDTRLDDFVPAGRQRLPVI